MTINTTWLGMRLERITKTSYSSRKNTGSARLRVILLAVASLLLANVAPAPAAPATVLHKDDGTGWRMSYWLGGWEGTGGPDRLYFWMEVPQGTTVLKQTPAGLLWEHDSLVKGTVVIASAGPGEDADTVPHDIRCVGVGTMVDTGLWGEYAPGVFGPVGKMTWTITATVTDVSTGQEWHLYWHFVLRGEAWQENYSFEPLE